MTQRSSHRAATRHQTCRSALHISLTALAVLSALATGMPGEVRAQEAATQITLPAQSLDDALIQLGRQTSLQFFYTPETVFGLQAPAVSGNMTPEQALQRLLQGTPVEYRLDGRNVTLTRTATTATLATIAVQGRRTDDEIGHDNVYDKDISNLYVDRQYMERYQGVSVGDVFAGMNGVYNSDNRHGSALFPNIRGLSGNGRIPVTVDGTQQSLDVWMAMRGVNNRNYVDPNLFRSIEVEKGPSMTRGIKSGIGGSVNIRTIEAGDIIAPGKNWGLEFKIGTASNSVKDDFDPNSIVGKDYRDIPGAYTTAPWGNAGVSFIKPQMEMRERGEVSQFNGDDRKVFISGAYKHEVFDVLLTYSDSRRGNYFAGTKGADGYDGVVGRQATSTGESTSVTNLYPYMAKIYAPGYEVPYTSTEAQSILAKNNWYLPNNQKISLSYMHNRQNFGEMPVFASEVYNILVVEDPTMQLARTQFLYPFINSRVDQKTYRLGYEFKPEGSRWLDLEVSLWRTVNQSTRYQNGDVPYQVDGRDTTWDGYSRCMHHPDPANDYICSLMLDFGMLDPDNPPAKLPNTDGQYDIWVGNRQDTHAVRTGLDASNRFQLTDRLALTAMGNWQYERIRDSLPVKTMGVMGMGVSNVSFGPASGRREEYGTGLNLDWQATDRLQLSAGVRYSSYWGHDDETDLRRDEQHDVWAYNRVNTHQTIYYRQVQTDEEIAMMKDMSGDERTAYQDANHYSGTYYDRVNGVAYWDVQYPVELRDGKADRNQNPFYNGQIDTTETVEAQGGTRQKYITGALGTAYKFVRPDNKWQHTERRRSHAWSAQLGASYLVTDRARVYGRLSSMARFPSIMEFANRNGAKGEFPYTPKPERNQAWEFGVAYDLSGMLSSVPVADVKLSYYHNTIRNFYDRTENMNTIQFDRKIMSGLELQSRFDTGRFYGGLAGTLRLRQDMCDADYAVQLDPVYNRWSECMPGGFVGTMSYFSLQPKYSINLDLGTRLLDRKLDLGMRYRYHSRTDNKKIERLIAQNPASNSLPGLFGGSMPAFSWRPVSLFDVYAEYNFSHHISGRLTVENLTDRYYLDPMAKVPMPGPGRTVRMDLTLRF